MILGRKLRNLAAWPSFRLKADAENCIICKKCTYKYPMSLDVNHMVATGKWKMRNVFCAHNALITALKM